jgi:curved DNA-binding protein CbpA
MRQFTGQLTLASDGKAYAVAFSQGAVIGAYSPLPSDAAVRVALTGHLISSTQVADIARRQAAAAGREEVELVAELARLSPDQALRLRRRVVAQRAARTFSIDRGDFVLDEDISIVVVPGAELDIRAVIYLGSRQNLSEARLASELGQIGTWFMLKEDVVDDLPQYGFGEAERPVLERLLDGADLAELETAAPGIEQRMVRSVVYSLASCNAFEPDGSTRAAVARTASASRPPPPRTRTTAERPAVARNMTPRLKTAEPPPQSEARARTPSIPIGVSERAGAAFDGERPRTMTTPVEARTRTPVDPTTPPIVGRAHTTGPIPPRTTSGPMPSRTTSGPMSSRTTSGAIPSRRSAPDLQATLPPLEDDSGVRFKASTTSPPPADRTPTGGGRTKPRTTMPLGARTGESINSEPEPEPPVRIRSTSAPPPRASTPPPVAGTRSRDPTPIKVAATRRRSDSGAKQIERLIEERIALVDDGVDHFGLLGVEQTASGEEIRDAYYGLARQLHPDRLAALGITDPARQAHRLFAQVNTAFAVLSDSRRRRDYITVLQKGGEAVVRQEQAKVDETAVRAVAAEDAFRRGEMAMRRDQLPQAIEEFKRAIDLDKNEGEYHAMLAWAEFCAAPDKMQIATATRGALDKAIGKSSPKSVLARFYLGRVERMLGRDREALSHFHDVLSIMPNHSDATSEIRVIETRLQANAADKSSKSGIFKRKH